MSEMVSGPTPLSLTLGLVALGLSYSYETGNDIQTVSVHAVNITSLEHFYRLDDNTLAADTFEGSDVNGPLDREHGFATDEDEKSAIAHTYGESRSIGPGVLRSP